MASSITLPTKEEVQAMAVSMWETTKANFVSLKEAGLFKMEHAVSFTKELALPFDKENFSVPAMQALILAQKEGPELTKGFTIMNAVTFYLEVLGSLLALLLGRALPLFIFEIVYAFVVAYVLYWLVVQAVGNDYKLVAIMLYVVYSIINTIQAVTTLVLIVPPLFFFCKTIASLCCAYYAFKIEKLTAGASVLKDEVELGVAE